MGEPKATLLTRDFPSSTLRQPPVPSPSPCPAGTRREKVRPVAFHVGANTVSPTTNSETLGQSADFIRPGLPQADDTGGSTLPAGLLQEVREVLRGIQDYDSPLPPRSCGASGFSVKQTRPVPGAHLSQRGALSTCALTTHNHLEASSSSPISQMRKRVLAQGTQLAARAGGDSAVLHQRPCSSPNFLSTNSEAYFLPQMKIIGVLSIALELS